MRDPIVSVDEAEHHGLGVELSNCICVFLTNEDVNVIYIAEFNVMLCSNKLSLLLYAGICHTGIKHNFLSGYIQRHGIQALPNLIL